MKLAMIGFGQAGGKIVDKFLEYDAKPVRTSFERLSRSTLQKPISWDYNRSQRTIAY